MYLLVQWASILQVFAMIYIRISYKMKLIIYILGSHIFVFIQSIAVLSLSQGSNPGTIILLLGIASGLNYSSI